MVLCERLINIINNIYKVQELDEGDIQKAKVTFFKKMWSGTRVKKETTTWKVFTRFVCDVKLGTEEAMIQRKRKKHSSPPSL